VVLIAFYLREYLSYKVVARSTSSSVAAILVCAIYNSPNINGFSILGSKLEPLISKYSDVLILSDFDHDVLKNLVGRVSSF
jgi:hypothetical protein